MEDAQSAGKVGMSSSVYVCILRTRVYIVLCTSGTRARGSVGGDGFGEEELGKQEDEVVDGVIEKKKKVLFDEFSSLCCEGAADELDVLKLCRRCEE